YGVGGVAVLVETMTDNIKRTVTDVRHAFTKCGGNLGTSGSVDYLFTKRGELTFAEGDEDKIMDIALEAGADDVITEADGTVMVITTPHNFGHIQDALEAAGLKAVHAEVTMHPATQAEITDIEQAQKIIKMIEMLEDSDDVQNVYSNVHFSDEVMDALNK
ncbi:MAG: YebC/PmpR family DNA-binding transcriptional regulator, partial [Pseudomonadales bacterium]|nr:YebC/PmpR family DNA-binding transcriptional regulator [Pseudomonadales bacterium]